MKSNIEWKDWGERDPLYAVSTWPGKESGSSNAWTDDEFYALGRSDWADFCKRWQYYGVRPGHCLEIGCGAGRITKELANFFERVTAIDVSSHQLAYAKGHISAPNIDFVLTEGVEVPLAGETCEAAFSCHVFQHFESHNDAFAVFREIHRVLSRDGSLMIHLPVYQLPDMPIAALFKPIIRLVKRTGDLRAAFHRKRLLNGKWRFVMRRLRFERDELIASLRRIGFAEIEFLRFPVRSNNDYHEFVFARKPPGAASLPS